MRSYCKALLSAFAGIGAAWAAQAAEPVAAAAAGAPGYHIVDRIPLSDGWWDYANVDPVTRSLYLTRGNGLFRMDLDSGLMDQRYIPGSEGRAVIPIPGTDMMVTTMAGYSAAIFFTPKDGKVAKMVSLKQASDSAVWEPTAKRVWVMGGSGEASLLDPVTLKQTGTVDFGDEALEFSATDGKGRVFVNGSESASVLVADARTQKVIARWKMKDCEDPSGMAYVEHADVVMSVCFNNMLKVLDARTGKEVATIPVGKGADAVIYDKTTHRAYVPSAYDGHLTVIAVNSRTDIEVLEQATTQIGTRTGAIDTQTGTIYLPTARMGMLNKLGWPEALPGTVEMLVLKPSR